MQARRNGRILLVDDEPDMAYALSERLKRGSGFEVETAGDGRAGLEKTASFDPDVILLDIAMPVMDGWECLSRLRGDPKTRDVPVVIMTAWLSDDLKERARSAGAARFLVKPFDENELVDIVRALAKGRTG